MFPTRLMSFGLRFTLQRMQDNITSMRTLTIKRPALHFHQQKNNFGLSRTTLAQLGPPRPLEADTESEDTQQPNAQPETNTESEQLIVNPFIPELSSTTESQNTEVDFKDTNESIEQIKGSFKISFTCKKCGERSYNKVISKLSYYRGVVIVRCNGCQNNHLIADNLGWFGPEKHKRNIEKILREKGETVKRVEDYDQGYLEYVAHEEIARIQRLIQEQREANGENVKPVEELEETVKIQYEKVGQSNC